MLCCSLWMLISRAQTGGWYIPARPLPPPARSAPSLALLSRCNVWRIVHISKLMSLSSCCACWHLHVLLTCELRMCPPLQEFPAAQRGQYINWVAFGGDKDSGFFRAKLVADYSAAPNRDEKLNVEVW